MSNDNEFTLKKIEIFNGYESGNPDVARWYVNHHYSDGTESIVDDKPSYKEALGSAVYGGMEDRVFNVPIEDNCTLR
ncbi:hypothetical protein [Sphingobium fuliginis]|jgi:hypothetical protein|uniref:hypothetical protein n=1 Tax=Sphingobium fuliginis (strain ATCC 27551) TaxID=336203 RepID=UPI0037C82582